MRRARGYELLRPVVDEYIALRCARATLSSNDELVAAVLTHVATGIWIALVGGCTAAEHVEKEDQRESSSSACMAHTVAERADTAQNFDSAVMQNLGGASHLTRASCPPPQLAARLRCN